MVNNKQKKLIELVNLCGGIYSPGGPYLLNKETDERIFAIPIGKEKEICWFSWMEQYRFNSSGIFKNLEDGLVKSKPKRANAYFQLDNENKIQLGSGDWIRSIFVQYYKIISDEERIKNILDEIESFEKLKNHLKSQEDKIKKYVVME